MTTGFRRIHLIWAVVLGIALICISFGSAAHIIAQVARWQEREVFAFTKPQDDDARRFARELGAVWAGDSAAAPPVKLDAAIIFAPAGHLLPQALRHVAKGGTVVCAGIHMSDISRASPIPSCVESSRYAPSPILPVTMAKHFLIWPQRWASKSM
jgi:D-arabinose 1-dehydrogenase-like Zn-dependent alcohol dehydrogenase